MITTGSIFKLRNGYAVYDSHNCDAQLLIVSDKTTNVKCIVNYEASNLI